MKDQKGHLPEIVLNVWWSCWSCPRLVGISPHYVVVQVQIFVLFPFSNQPWTFLCCCLVTKSCPTLCNPMKCSPPDSSVHGIPQAKILNSVAIFFSREYSSPRDQSHVFCIGKRIFTTEPSGSPPICKIQYKYLEMKKTKTTSSIQF